MRVQQNSSRIFGNDNRRRKNWSGPDPIRLQWRSTPMCIYFKDVFPNGTELQNIRSRTTRNNSSIGRMVTLCSRIRAYNDYLFRPQEFNLLQDDPKIESTTSKMVVIPIGI